MNGAQSLLQTLVDAGVEVCFTNPGTSEMHFVAALDQQDGMRGVLGLFEGVVTGAADGYARMAGKPACTLLHLGPGLANGLANLHNARRANSPVVNVVGEHATYHRALDAPLTSDIAGFAAPVSAWVRVSESAGDVAADAAEAVRAAAEPPGHIATLILPADTAWNDASGPAEPLAVPEPGAPDDGAVAESALALMSGEPCLMLLNGLGVSEAGLALASRIARATGARLLADTFIARMPRGAGRVEVDRVPYFTEQAEEVLAGTRHLILVDTKAPVSFFAYPGRQSVQTPAGCAVHQLTVPGQDTLAALSELADRVGAAPFEPEVSALEPPGLPEGPIDAEKVMRVLGALLPEQAIIVNEAATSGITLHTHTRCAAPHDLLDLTGGAIGMGMPAATGAAIACPGRRVVSLEADGSGMYTVQALWTQARESLDVTTVLFSNRKYAILQIEFMRVGAHNPGPKAMDMMDLSRPDLDWVGLAAGMGVPGMRAETAGEFADAFARSIATPGPYLIEVVV
ncbi:MAG: acetolactate synthase large subunit [Gammaproteobacteria bacterium]|nr:acetolactate synthase large subunit [Gammaproteobacteria bacterium]